jgi:hypothetical protein
MRSMSILEEMLEMFIYSSHIQGDSGGICTSLGNDSMRESKQKSSRKHGSDFERLRSYDRLKLGIEDND